jgi:transcriptional regulator with XRE-family HTH domain
MLISHQDAYRSGQEFVSNSINDNKLKNLYKRDIHKCNQSVFTYDNIFLFTFVYWFLVMKERLLQLLDLEHLSPSKFADIIGVQRSSVSHVLSGRNKPSFDFLQKTLKAFPGLKADWLILGEGPMYERMGRELQTDLFGNEGTLISEGTAAQEESRDKGTSEDEVSEGFEYESEEVESRSPGNVAEHRGREETGEKRKIIQVMILYDDDTFSTFRPSQ